MHSPKAARIVRRSASGVIAHGSARAAFGASFSFLALLLSAAQRVTRKRGPVVFIDGVGLWLNVAVVAAAVALGEKQRREQWGDDRSWRERFLEHPLVAWALENAAVFGIAAAGTIAVRAPSFQSPLSTFRALTLNSSFGVWVTMIVQGIYTHKIYSHIPSFGGQGRSGSGRPDPSVPKLIQDYVRTNVPVELFNAAMISTIVAGLTASEWKAKIYYRGFFPVGFLAKMMVARVGIDLGFWAGHMALHHKNLYWIHKRHHEHHKPSLATNFHFSPLDLFIESTIPAALGLGMLEALGVNLSRFETNLIASYMVWHESGSHAGKPMPTTTYFPPLAPLYQLILGPVDRNNVKHHDLHHALLNCNYGITIWPDILFGTRVENLPSRPSTGEPYDVDEGKGATL